jgi:hypothetical protein
VTHVAIDRNLVKRILEHYKERLDGFLQDEKIKPLATDQLSPHIAKLKQDVDNALAALTAVKSDLDSETKNWMRTHASILRPAVSQYDKDARMLLEEARERLSAPDLRQLEIELARVAAEIAGLLNL